MMTLDHDNLYEHKNAFNKLYRDAEYYNLDLLAFATIGTTVKVKNIADNNFINYIRTKIIKKPDIKIKDLLFLIKEMKVLLIYVYILLKLNFL